MANAMQGIMALPGAPENMNQEPGLPPPGPGPAGIDPSLIDPKATEYARSDPEGFGRDMVDNLGQADPNLVLELRNALAGMQLPAEVIDALLTMIDVLLQDPANYQQNRQMFIDEGVPQEFLPPNFDPIFLTGMQMALSEMNRTPQPRQFANGGIAELRPIAKMLSEMGRNGDTMLAHITPREARMLRVMGGSGTMNPYTGLPEFFLDKAWKAVTGAVKDVGNAVVGAVKNTAKIVGSVVKGAANVVKEVVKPVANVVKKIASNPVGRIALTIAATIALGPAGLTTAGVAGSMGLSGAVALGVNTALASTAVNLASGMKLKEALRGGAISGLTAGTISALTNTLPAAYRNAPITPTAGQIPPPAIGDYASTADAAALEAAAAREAADFAAQAAATAPNAVAAGVPAAAGAPGAVGAAGGAPELGPVINYPAPNPPGVGVPEVTAPRVELPTTVATAPLTTTTDVTAGVTGAPAAVPPAPPTPPAAPYEFIDSSTVVPGYEGGNIPTMAAPAAPYDFIDSSTVVPGYEGGNIPTTVATAPSTPPAGPYDFVDSSTVVPGYEGGNIPATPTTAIDEYNAMYGNVRGAPEGTMGPPSFVERGLESAKNFYDTYLSPDRASAAGSGLFVKYGPLALAGAGALAAGGAFKTEQPAPPGIVNREYMREGVPGKDIGLGGVNTLYAPTQGYSPAMGLFGAPQFRVRSPEEYLPQMFYSRGYATGGIASLRKGGAPRTYPRKTGAINGPGTGTSDSIPALLSDGEFVFTAKAVRGAGNGSRRLGAKRMYAMMKALERKANAN